jgi:membrane peptidoglycan carboxypeptidase
MEASAEVRQEVYGWLFKSLSLHKQNKRIRIFLEEDAFDGVLQDWRRQGYPFGHLVPSYGTAVGSSGDRPDALADLMGIILNDGVRLPSDDLDRLHFAAGTPYETDMVLRPEPQRVLAPEVARTLRQALLGVERPKAPLPSGNAGSGWSSPGRHARGFERLGGDQIRPWANSESGSQ